MSRPRIAQASLSGGELSPRLQDRADLQVFYEGAAVLENLIVLREGGAIRRPGTEFVGLCRLQSQASRLIPFIKSDQDALVCEFSSTRVGFRRAQDKTAIMNGGSPLLVDSPFGGAALGFIYTWQSADVMYVTDLSGLRAPRALIRFGDTDWEFNPYIIKNGPFFSRNEEGVTVTLTNDTGATALTASANLFRSGHVGSLWRFWETAVQPPVPRWEPGKTVSNNDLRESLGRVYRATGSGDTGTQPPVHEIGTVSDGAVSWEYLHDGAGAVRITAVTSPTQAEGTVEERLAKAALTTPFWAEGAFSVDRGWPRLGGIYEERFFLVASPSQPDTIHGSRTAGYSPFDADFKPGSGTGEVVDSDAIRRTLADSQVNQPAWLIAAEQLMLGTPNGVVRISGPTLDEAIVPASAVARRIQNSPGASRRCRAVEAAEHVLYPARGGRRLIELNVKSQQSRDLTVRAEQVGASPLIDLAWVGEPHGRLFARREDERLYVLTYAPTEDVVGWAPVVLGGRFDTGPPRVESICAAPDATGEDRLWLTVRRTVDGQTVRSIEILTHDYRENRQSLDRANFMDAAVHYDRWNTDPARRMALEIDAGGEALREAQGVLTATGHSPFGDPEQVWLDARADEPGAGDPPGPLMLEILEVLSSTQARVRLLNDAQPGQMDSAVWALPQRDHGGLSHLEGETVRVQADGEDMGLHVVEGGTVEIAERPMARGWIGLPTRWRGRSMPVIAQSPRGDTRGALIRVERMRVGFVDSVSGRLRVVVDDREMAAEDLITRTQFDPITAVLRPRSGSRMVTVEASRGDKVQIEIFGEDALPFTLTGITAEISVDD
jgi:hypothetical protein